MAVTSPAYFRPDHRAQSWATIQRGIRLQLNRRAGDFVQVTYREFDQLPNPNCITAEVTGWVDKSAVSQIRRRFFFLLGVSSEKRLTWDHHADHDAWSLFWAPVESLPPIIPPQDTWVPYLHE